LLSLLGISSSLNTLNISYAVSVVVSELDTDTSE